MPIYEEMIKTKDGKMVNKLVDRQKIYYIRTYVTDEFGKRKQITKHNKKWIGIDGKREATAEENRLQNNTHIEIKNIYFSELCDIYLNYQKKINKESTYYTYFQLAKKWIIPHFNKKVKSLSQKDFIVWREFISKQNLSINMQNKCHILLSNILKYGIRYNYISINYEQNLGAFKKKNENIKQDSKIRYITYEQFKIFISFVDNLHWKTFFTFLYYTGMRKGEVQALTWEDIDFNNNQILVSKNLTAKTFDAPYKITNTKTKENRKIDMDIFLKKTMLDYYNIKKGSSDFNKQDFVFGDKKPLSRATIDRYKKYYFKKANIPEITIHEFRHSHVSLIINESVKRNLDMLGVFIMLSERMGHTIEVMQQVYMHLFPNIQSKVVDIMNDLDTQDQEQNQKQNQKQDQKQDQKK